MMMLPNKPQVEEATPANTEGKLISVFGVITVVIIVLCYYMIDHGWNASELANTNAENYTSGDENATADRISVVNPLTSAFRILLGFWGFFCIALAPNFRFRTSSLLFWSVCTVALFLLASVMWSARPSQTIVKLAVLGTIVMAGFGMATMFRLREILTIITLTCIAFIFIGVVAEIAHGRFRPGPNYRFIGTYHPNAEAIFASLICMISRMYLSKLGWGNFFGTVLFVGGMVVVWYTKSRTTLAGLLFSLMVTQTLVAQGANRVLLIVSLISIASLGVAASSMVSQSSSGAFGKIATMGREDDVSSMSGRLPLWEELLISANKKPILGYGYLAFWDAEKVEYLSGTFGWEIPHGHNLYLDVFLDGGIIGLSLVLLSILIGFGEAAKFYSSGRQIEYAIIFGVFSYAVVNGLAESIFKLPNFSLFVVLTFCFSMITEPMKATKRWS